MSFNYSDLFEKQKKYFNSCCTLNVSRRIKLLKLFKKNIIKHYDEILKAFKADLNKPEGEVYFCEYLLVLNEINTIVKKLKGWTKPKRVCRNLLTIFSSSLIYHKPYGNVLIIAPWNYPFNLSLVPLVDAIAAGNTAMVFLNSFTKEVNEIIKTIVSETFLPELVVCFNNSDVPYDELLKPNFDYVFFTGSENVGKIVATKCGEKLIPYTLELGGKCPVLVLEDADVEIAAKRIVRGKLFNSGQTCVAPDYVYVHKNVYDDFVVALKKYIELYQNDTTELTKFVSPKHFERIRSLLQNQEIILEGEVDEKNLVASLTVIRTEENSPVMQEEIFGPILPLIVYEDLGEKLNILRTAKSPLALYVFSSSKQRYNSILRMLKCGTSCWNDTVLQISNNNLPFGGVGSSGMGHYHGKFGFETFSHLCSVLKSHRDIKLMYPPFNSKKVKLFKKLLKN